MLMIVTNKEDFTADYLIIDLKRKGIDFVRLNTEDFPDKVSLNLHFSKNSLQGQIRLSNTTIDIFKIKSIWYRRPIPSIPAKQIIDKGAKDFVISESREALEGLWRLLPCFWVSHPDNIRRAESKLLQLHLASEINLSIPPTMLTNSPATAKKFFQKNSGSLIYKPLHHSMIERGENISLIYTNVLNDNHSNSFENVQLSPSLFQKYIEKLIELRVIVVGNQVFAVELHSQELEQAKHDWRKVDAIDIKHIPHELPNQISKKCVKLVQILGLSFSAMDFILTPEGNYVFLELNPNGQWAWLQQLCPDVHIREALIALLTSPETRI